MSFNIDGNVSELDNLNEVLSVRDEMVEASKKGKGTKGSKGSKGIDGTDGDVETLDDLNEVIRFETPVSEVMTLNE